MQDGPPSYRLSTSDLCFLALLRSLSGSADCKRSALFRKLVVMHPYSTWWPLPATEV